jgi:hypothetical protein
MLEMHVQTMNIMNTDQAVFITLLSHSRKVNAEVDIQIGVESAMIHSSFLALSYLVVAFDK